MLRYSILKLSRVSGSLFQYLRNWGVFFGICSFSYLDYFSCQIFLGSQFYLGLKSLCPIRTSNPLLSYKSMRHPSSLAKLPQSMLQSLKSVQQRQMTSFSLRILNYFQNPSMISLTPFFFINNSFNGRQFIFRLYLGTEILKLFEENENTDITLSAQVMAKSGQLRSAEITLLLSLIVSLGQFLSPVKYIEMTPYLLTQIITYFVSQLPYPNSIQGANQIILSLMMRWPKLSRMQRRFSYVPRTTFPIPDDYVYLMTVTALIESFQFIPYWNTCYIICVIIVLLIFSARQSSHLSNTWLFPTECLTLCSSAQCSADLHYLGTGSTAPAPKIRRSHRAL